MKNPFSLPEPPAQRFPTPEEFAAVKTVNFELAEANGLLESQLAAANATIARLRAGDRSPVERALLRERDELNQKLYDLDERNAGLRLENEQLTRERDDALAHAQRLADKAGVPCPS